MKPIKKVIIKDEKYEDGYSELIAKISEKGDLVIDGCDAGELAEEPYLMNVQVTKQYNFLKLLTFCNYDVFHLNPKDWGSSLIC